jgi:hypothetical protein
MKRRVKSRHTRRQRARPAHRAIRFVRATHPLDRVERGKHDIGPDY